MYLSVSFLLEDLGFHTNKYIFHSAVLDDVVSDSVSLALKIWSTYTYQRFHIIFTYTEIKNIARFVGSFLVYLTWKRLCSFFCTLQRIRSCDSDLSYLQSTKTNKPLLVIAVSPCIFVERQNGDVSNFEHLCSAFLGLPVLLWCLSIDSYHYFYSILWPALGNPNAKKARFAGDHLPYRDSGMFIRKHTWAT